MSTIQKVNFEPTQDMIPVVRRDYTVADRTLLAPTNPVTLVDGEWMTLDTTGKLVRATDVTTPGAEVTNKLPLLWWMETGRYDAQASGRGAVLFAGEWEADCRVFDAAAVVGSGLAITTMGQYVKVATVTIGTRNYTGLVGSQQSDTSPIVGVVTRLPAANGGKLRVKSSYRR